MNFLLENFQKFSLELFIYLLIYLFIYLFIHLSNNGNRIVMGALKI